MNEYEIPITDRYFTYNGIKYVILTPMRTASRWFAATLALNGVLDMKSYAIPNTQWLHCTLDHPANPTMEDVKVVLTYREPEQRIASLYSHMSSVNPTLDMHEFMHSNFMLPPNAMSDISIHKSLNGNTPDHIVNFFTKEQDALLLPFIDKVVTQRVIVEKRTTMDAFRKIKQTPEYMDIIEDKLGADRQYSPNS